MMTVHYFKSRFKCAGYLLLKVPLRGTSFFVSRYNGPAFFHSFL